MTALSTRVAAVVAALAIAVTVTSCTEAAQTSDSHTDHEHPTSSAEGEAPHNADDISFATNMIPHHQQAVDLTELVPTRTDNAALIDLASRIAEEQTPEIQTMQAMLVSWGQDVDAPADHSGHAGMEGMQGMVDTETMTRLESLNGAEFDTLWLESMIAHHQGAIEMAKAEIAHGESGDAKTLAEHIVSAQQAEITEMNEMLGR